MASASLGASSFAGQCISQAIAATDEFSRMAHECLARSAKGLERLNWKIDVWKEWKELAALAQSLGRGADTLDERRAEAIRIWLRYYMKE
jgi:hypothetical protein